VLKIRVELMIVITNKNKAFTLAEILITLTIIGVIAALTIPTLLQNKNEQELKTAYKKMYATLSQAAARLVSDSGGTLKGDLNYVNRFTPYLNVSKICSNSEIYGNCWHKMGEFKYLKGTPVTGYGDEMGMVLSDGSLLFFGNKSIDCSNAIYGVATCAVIRFDVNGFKKPNTFGKDIFDIHLFPTTIKPLGIPEDSFNPNTDCSPTGTGQSCGYKILTEQ